MGDDDETMITPRMAQALADEGREPTLVFDDGKLEVWWPTGTKVIVEPASGDHLAYTLR